VKKVTTPRNYLSLADISRRTTQIIQTQGFLVDEFRATGNKRLVKEFKALADEFMKLHQLEKQLRWTPQDFLV
jgi:hypothetical protein